MVWLQFWRRTDTFRTNDLKHLCNKFATIQISKEDSHTANMQTQTIEELVNMYKEGLVNMYKDILSFYVYII